MARGMQFQCVKDPTARFAHQGVADDNLHQTNMHSKAVAVHLGVAGGGAAATVELIAVAVAVAVGQWVSRRRRYSIMVTTRISSSGRLTTKENLETLALAILDVS
ncbi:hypothetical protein J6590_004666 [Homalodisca vitripennis]|nr:hypothetical protein J6590_004666 [Homalodisca vitripennis]